MYLINDNCYPIQINSIETNNFHFTLDMEVYYSIDRNNSIIKYDYSLKGNLPVKIQKGKGKEKDKNNNMNLNLTIYQKTAVLLSVNIKTKKK